MNDAIESKDRRGGRWEGAGRKAIPHGKAVTFRTTPEVDALLDSYTGNKTAMLNAAILEYFRNRRH